MLTAAVALGALPAPLAWKRLTSEIRPGETVYARSLVPIHGRLVVIDDKFAYRSDDGVRWSRETRKGSSRDPRMYNPVPHNNQLWMLGSYDASGRFSRRVLASSDGVEWWPLGEMVFDDGLRLSHADQICVIQKNGNIWRSRDGSGWTSEGGWPWRSPIGTVSAQGFLFVFDADGSLYRDRELIFHNGPWKGRFRPTFCAWRGGIAMIGGTGARDYYTTPDGERWTRRELPSTFRSRAALRLAPWRDGLVVLGGKTGEATISNPQDCWFLTGE